MPVLMPVLVLVLVHVLVRVLVLMPALESYRHIFVSIPTTLTSNPLASSSCGMGASC